MKPTPELIPQITQFLDASTPLPQQADLIFIFGTRLLTPAELAAGLFKQGVAPYIAVTGGINRLTGVVEGRILQAYLVAQGVPAGAIIVEERSTNSYENVTLARPLIEQKLPAGSIRQILAICKWYHSRRALMTLKSNMPPGIRYSAWTYEPEGISRENWPTRPDEDVARVMKEWEYIPLLLRKGDIGEITRAGDVYV